MASNAGSGIRLTDESARLFQNDITCESADITKFRRLPAGSLASERSAG